jgi:putative hydrolase of the HAD superfamily
MRVSSFEQIGSFGRFAQMCLLFFCENHDRSDQGPAFTSIAYGNRSNQFKIPLFEKPKDILVRGKFSAQYKYILFDLDDTLYPREAGVMEAIIERILLYMIHKVNIPPDDVSTKRHHYHQNYGTALRGLMTEYNIEPSEFLDFVHDINPADFFGASPPLDRMLAAIPLRKVIFTNSDIAHSERVLQTLRVRDHFEQIFDIRAVNFISKPDPIAYQHVLSALGVSGYECIMVEDSPRNLIPAKDLGMRTILIGQNGDSSAIDHMVPTVFHVERILANFLVMGG